VSVLQDLGLRAGACALTLSTGALLAVAAGAPGPRQEEGPAKPAQVRELGAQEELVELFQSVERRLAEIDELLYGASAGERALEETGESGIDHLLRVSRERGQEVVRSIDRILELAQQNAQASSSSSSGSEPRQGSSQGSPLDQEPGAAQEKEKTPSAPKERPDGSEQESEPERSQANDPRQSAGDPRNQPGPPPPSPSTEKVAAPNDAERWGDLPLHVRDLFRTEGGGDLPPQYRDWIDAYYRRLNRKP